MKWVQIVFSPTGGTQKVADILTKSLTNTYTTVDLSDRTDDFSQYRFDADDLCLVAVPSFGGRVPGIAMERIKKITGGNARAILVVVYGNRAYKDTLLELKNGLKGSGFRCVAAVTAIAEHSIFHQFATGRPDARDKEKLISLAGQIHDSLTLGAVTDDVLVPGNAKYKEFKGSSLAPKADDRCNGCGLCAQKCPVGAIPADDPSKIDADRCIGCMRCIALCPQEARHVNKMLLVAGAQKLKKACAARKHNDIFI